MPDGRTDGRMVGWLLVTAIDLIARSLLLRTGNAAFFLLLVFGWRLHELWAGKEVERREEEEEEDAASLFNLQYNFQ